MNLISVGAIDLQCCCSPFYLPVSGQHRTLTLDDPRTFHCNDYLGFGEIRACLRVSCDPMFLWICSNSCSLNLLLVQSHQAEIIIVKRLSKDATT